MLAQCEQAYSYGYVGLAEEQDVRCRVSKLYQFLDAQSTDRRCDPYVLVSPLNRTACGYALVEKR